MKKFFVALLVVILLFNIGFVVFLPPLLYTLTPLQRYYLAAYLASSWHEKDPAATTEIRLIWKFKPETGSKSSKPKLQYDLATENDLLPIPARELLWKGDILPFWMNRKAEMDGWIGVRQGLPMEVNSAKLAVLLRQEFFQSKPVWRFFVQPAMMLVAASLLWFLFWSWQRARRERYMWRKPVPLWLELGRRVLSAGSDFRRSIRTHQALSVAVPKHLPKVHPSAEPVAAQRATPAVTAQAELPPTETRVGKSKAFVWDKSKGID